MSSESFGPKSFGALAINVRQQLLMVEIYEVDTDVDTLIARPGENESAACRRCSGHPMARATLPLAEPRLEHTAPWPLVRGSDAGGTSGATSEDASTESVDAARSRKPRGSR